MYRARLVIGALTVAAAFVSSAQKPPKVVTGPWTPATESVSAFARAVDDRLAGFRMIEGAYKAGMKMNGSGESIGDFMIRDDKVFHYEFPEMHYRKTGDDDPMTKLTAKSDGQWVEISGGGVTKRQMSPARLRLYTGKTVEDWVFGAPRDVAASIHGERTFADLVRKATTAGSGYAVAFQQRQVSAMGRNFPQARLVVTRTPQSERLKGPLRIEIVFSLTEHLPVHIITTKTPLAGQRADIDVILNWRARRSPFDPSLFKIYR